MTERPVLDRIDRRILDALQVDGRLTNQALSERVALSPSACLARVRRLEESGVIRGYHARVDPFALDIGLVLYVEVTLSRHGIDELNSFENVIKGMDAVVEASHVTGAFDYLLKVVVTDMSEWTVVKESITSAAVSVERLNTHVMMGKPKFFVGYPVDHR